MEENAFEKIQAMLSNGNIPNELKDIISNINSSKKNDASQNNNISPESISTLINMLNSNKKTEEESSTNTENHENKNDSNSNFNFDLETIMKLKSIIDKMNSKEDPRSKLLISLKPYLKNSRKNKVDQYIQFFNMSKIIDAFSKNNGDDKL